MLDAVAKQLERSLHSGVQEARRPAPSAGSSTLTHQQACAILSCAAGTRSDGCSPLHRLADPAAIGILQRLGQVPVVESDIWLDAGGLESIDQLVVELHAILRARVCGGMGGMRPQCWQR